MFKKVTRRGSKNGAKSTKFKATSNCNISSQKQAFDKLSKARMGLLYFKPIVCVISEILDYSKKVIFVTRTLSLLQVFIEF